MDPKNENPVYFNAAYDTRERFNSYWHQVDEVMSRAPENVLEVGIGNGFLNTYLNRKGVDTVGLDYDAALNPDIIGDVKKLPMKDNSFDMCVCFEVLEHMPYEYFSPALSELRRVSREWVVISIPDVSRVFRIFMELPVVGWFKIMVPKISLKKQKHVDTNKHHWNIGETDHPLEKIKNDIVGAGFSLEKTYRVFENPFHRFFVLRKIDEYRGDIIW